MARQHRTTAAAATTKMRSNAITRTLHSLLQNSQQATQQRLFDRVVLKAIQRKHAQLLNKLISSTSTSTSASTHSSSDPAPTPKNCIACMDQESTVCYDTCDHLCLCAECHSRMKIPLKCPMCNVLRDHVHHVRKTVLGY